MAKPSSCGRSCGRTLLCGNHYCERDCHRVKNAPDTVQAGTNCRKCESECLKPRPEGCNHACLRPCHPDLCAPCGQMMKIWCNCGITQLYVKCGEWIAAGEERKHEMACCQDQCPKIMSCGHRFVKNTFFNCYANWTRIFFTSILILAKFDDFSNMEKIWGQTNEEIPLFSICNY